MHGNSWWGIAGTTALQSRPLIFRYTCHPFVIIKSVFSKPHTSRLPCLKWKVFAPASPLSLWGGLSVVNGGGKGVTVFTTPCTTILNCSAPLHLFAANWHYPLVALWIRDVRVDHQFFSICDFRALTAYFCYRSFHIFWLKESFPLLCIVNALCLLWFAICLVLLWLPIMHRATCWTGPHVSKGSTLLSSWPLTL